MDSPSHLAVGMRRCSFLGDPIISQKNTHAIATGGATKMSHMDVVTQKGLKDPSGFLLNKGLGKPFDLGITVKPIEPPKINMEAENDGLEDEFPFPVVYSQVPC